MTIIHWPKEDRPREKLLTHGAKMLTDAELIAIFIATGTRGRTALDIAKDLLHKFGSLQKLLQAPSFACIQQKGVGMAKYVSLKAALELGKRCCYPQIFRGELVNDSAAAKALAKSRLQDQANEVFACLFMDNRNRLISFDEIFQGSINETSIHPREIVRRGLAHNAAKTILTHNHPSGCPLPSQADKEVTALIKDALALVDIVVIDHIIVGKGETYSFADMGLMPFP